MKAYRRRRGIMNDTDIFGDFRRWNNEFFRRWNESLSEKGVREPVADVKDEADKILISIELPGIKKEDISLSVTEDTVEVKAETKHLVEERKKGYFRKERSYSGFYRSMTLPAKVIPESTQAKYEAGILEITLEKKEKKKLAEKKAVAVKVS